MRVGEEVEDGQSTDSENGSVEVVYMIIHY